MNVPVYTVHSCAGGSNFLYVFGEECAQFVSEFSADNVLFSVLDRLKEHFILDKGRADPAQHFRMYAAMVIDGHEHEDSRADSL